MPTIKAGGQRRQPTPIVTVNVDGRCRTCRIQIAFHCRSPCVCTGFSAFEVSVPEKPMRYRKLGALLETRCTFRPLCQGNSVEKCTEFSVSAPSLPVVHRVLRGASNLVRCIGFVPDLHWTRYPVAIISFIPLPPRSPTPLAPLAVPRMSAFPLRDMCVAADSPQRRRV